nr:MAG TPA: hypothetical protein [Caudoviricetes sp.]
MEISMEQKARIISLQNSFLNKVFTGGAFVANGTGLVLEKGTGLAAGGLRLVANGIEGAGSISSNACYKAGEFMEKKANEYGEELPPELIAAVLKQQEATA